MSKIEDLSVSPRLAGVVIDRHGQTVAVISGGVDGAPADYARLFAAAPYLLDALEDLLPYAEKSVDALDAKSAGDLYPRIRAAMLDRARAALAKARPS